MDNVKQLSLFEFASTTCADCICQDCLLWWSGRCPYGGCYDNLRATQNPYDAAHPNQQPRKGWTTWKTDQAHWCRGGIFYPQRVCPDYVQYKGSIVQSCLLANVQIFQDGYINCSLLDTMGCEECYRQFETRNLQRG